MRIAIGLFVLFLSCAAILQAEEAVRSQVIPEPPSNCVRILTIFYDSDQGVDRLDFAAPKNMADWEEIIEVIRTTPLHANGSFNSKVLPAVDGLDEASRSILIAKLVHEFRSLNKDPNRRFVELLFNRLFRPDLRFRGYLATGNTVEQAYRKVFAETRATIGDARSIEIDDMLEVAHGLQKKLKLGHKAFIVGSAPSGRAEIGSSDLDLAYINPQSPWKEWMLGKLTSRLRLKIYHAYEDGLAFTARILLKEHFQSLGQKVFVQMHDSTPGDVFAWDTWLHYGKQNPFVIAASADRIDLAVFDPPLVNDDGLFTYGRYEAFRLLGPR